jgi:Kdo-III transferase WaaZ
MRNIDSTLQWLRRKIHRASLPNAMRHMRSVHPDFRIDSHGGGADTIYWRGRPVGRINPLETLAPATTRDCFIVGTGPSLNDIDFAALRGRTCIGVNGSVLKSEDYSVPFRSHVISDRHFFNDRFELVRKALESGAECIFSFRGLSVVCEREPALLHDARVFLLNEITARYGEPKPGTEAFDAAAERDPDLVLHPRARPSEGRVGFSRDIRKGVFTGQTIVFSALQLAVWLGYRRVFILGMDLGGAGGRFYEAGSQAAPMRLDRDYEAYIRPAFEVAASLLGKLGVEVYNLSERSRLPSEIVPKLAFEQALEMSRGRA